MSLEVDVQGHLIFGVDEGGFYVLTNANACGNDPNAVAGNNIAAPEFVFSNLRGTLSGVGRLGPLEIEFEDAALTVDADVRGG